ncbi:MAG TPA: non-ribosomal peptide synthetase, partial [Caldithrix abyssi]|nr:non-ribosomal peptide synthetase [Caldithrix abyssi]
MSDLEKLLSKLSPEKRKLLELKLRKEGKLGNAFPLSYAQQRLWFLYQMEPGSTAYNIPAAVRLKGRLDQTALEKSLNEIVRRHEILRTTFTTINGTPMQVVSSDGKIDIQVKDISDLDKKSQEQTLNKLLAELNATHFDIKKGPLLKTSLFKLNTNEHILHIVMHHIISDGWSVSVFVNEFSRLYTSFLNDQPSPLPPLPIQYADFAVWQKKKLDTEIKEKQLPYWREKLGGELPVLQLPTDRPRPAVKSFRGSHRKGAIRGELVEELRQLSRQQNTTMFMTLLSAFYTLLYRYSGQDDISIGIPIANRNRAETEQLIGFFVNTLVLRNRFSGELTFNQLLEQTRNVSLEAFSHQDVPFEMLVEELQPERDLSHTPLFQVMFVHQNAEEGSLKLPGLEIEPVNMGNENAKFDLTLTVGELKNELLVNFEYDTDLFEAQTIDRMQRHFQRLLAAIVANPDTPIGLLPLID